MLERSEPWRCAAASRGASWHGGALATSTPASASIPKAHGCCSKQARCTGQMSWRMVGTSSSVLVRRSVSSGPARRCLSKRSITEAGQAKVRERSVRRSMSCRKAWSPVSIAPTQSSKPTTGAPPNISETATQSSAAALTCSSTWAPESRSMAVQRTSPRSTARSRGVTGWLAPDVPLSTSEREAVAVMLHSHFNSPGTISGDRCSTATCKSPRPDQRSMTSLLPAKCTSPLQTVAGSMPKKRRCSIMAKSARNTAKCTACAESEMARLVSKGRTFCTCR
mmetsp:Transcript_88324/g.189702  ORF Transcript_88324/g.189702 Transcript_88324/m.189702 type:complete len:280 (-) Transcript_88324:914-1753(-)